MSKIVALLLSTGLVAVGLFWMWFQPTRDLSEEARVDRERAPKAGPTEAPAILGQGDALSPRDLDALRKTVEEERLARLALAERVDRIQAQLDARERSVRTGDSSEDSDRPAESRGQAFEDDAGRASDDAAAITALTLDPAKLKEAGIHAGDADPLRESYSEMWMEWLELRRLSERGEIDEKELVDEKTKIRDRYRAELGDELFDLMLYAGGQENRVGVTDVLLGSPAQAAGLQAGDIILKIADERVFGTEDVVRATIELDADGTVPIVILRGGEEHHLSVPAGPLGVAITDQKGKPRT